MGNDTSKTPIKVGQVWRENDKRFERYACILHVGAGRRSIQIRTVIKMGDGWEFSASSRPTWCDPDRFGKGYKLHDDAHE